MRIKRFLKKRLGQYNASRLARYACIFPNMLCSFFPMKKEILLESNPDFSCNTFELYRFFMKKGVNKDFKLVWRVCDPSIKLDNDPENVYYIEKKPRGFSKRISNYIRCNRACISISCNTNLPKYKVSKKQLNIYLDHGSQLKSMKTKDGQKAPLCCDYLICQSRFFVPYNLQEYSVNEEQIICTGLPRYDQFYRKNDCINQLISDCKQYSKIVIWTPTFREHKNGYRVDCTIDYPYGLPFLYTEEDIRRLEGYLESACMLLVIKPHPVQDLSRLQLGRKNNNLRIILSEDLSKHGIQINELLSQTDAMITDYSSIYYDYLFTGHPIAITLDDFDRYQSEKGFVFENPLEILKGDLLYSTDDLIHFLENVSNGTDIHYQERIELQKRINDFDDGESSQRVYEFVMSKIEKRWLKKS